MSTLEPSTSNPQLSPSQPASGAAVSSSHFTDQDAVPEVEIVSLVGEELPKYRLRADYLTQFSGYSHQDFEGVAGIVETPTLSAAQEARVVQGLTPDLAAATLDYFIESGDRLSKMTRTYNDIEAVTRLLEEKETDLELAAKIGQELLERNRRLDDKVGGLEKEQAKANDLITQLRHELSIKSELLHAYSNDFVEASDMPSPMELRSINVELMQRKVRDLEEDNKKLHQEATEVEIIDFLF